MQWCLRSQVRATCAVICMLHGVLTGYCSVLQLTIWYSTAANIIQQLLAVRKRLCCADDIVRLDANNMMAGQTLMFELELVSIEPGRRASSSWEGASTYFATHVLEAECSRLYLLARSLQLHMRTVCVVLFCICTLFFTCWCAVSVGSQKQSGRPLWNAKGHCSDTCTCVVHKLYGNVMGLGLNAAHCITHLHFCAAVLGLPVFAYSFAK